MEVVPDRPERSGGLVTGGVRGTGKFPGVGLEADQGRSERRRQRDGGRRVAGTTQGHLTKGSRGYSCRSTVAARAAVHRRSRRLTGRARDQLAAAGALVAPRPAVAARGRGGGAGSPPSTSSADEHRRQLRDVLLGDQLELPGDVLRVEPLLLPGRTVPPLGVRARLAVAVEPLASQADVCAAGRVADVERRHSPHGLSPICRARRSSARTSRVQSISRFRATRASIR